MKRSEIGRRRCCTARAVGSNRVLHLSLQSLLNPRLGCGEMWFIRIATLSASRRALPSNLPSLPIVSPRVDIEDHVGHTARALDAALSHAARLDSLVEHGVCRRQIRTPARRADDLHGLSVCHRSRPFGRVFIYRRRALARILRQGARLLKGGGQSAFTADGKARTPRGRFSGGKAALICATSSRGFDTTIIASSPPECSASGATCR